MNRTVEQFLLLLASTPFSHRQIQDITHWVDVNGTAALEEAVQSLRGTAQKTLTQVEKKLPRTAKPVRPRNDSLPAEQIDILLRVEAGFSTGK